MPKKGERNYRAEILLIFAVLYRYTNEMLSFAIMVRFYNYMDVFGFHSIMGIYPFMCFDGVLLRNLLSEFMDSSQSVSYTADPKQHNP